MIQECHFDAVKIFNCFLGRRAFPILALVIVTLGCTGTPRSHFIDNLEIDKARPHLMPRFALDQSLSQTFYLKILAEEIKNGFSIDNRYTHANSGLILCAADTQIKSKSCILYGFLAGHAVPNYIWALEQEAQRMVLDHYADGSNKKEADGPVYIDIFCSYFGKLNPPFGVQESVCYLDNYRTAKQVYVTKAVAQEMMQKMSGSTAEVHGAPKTAEGTVSCLWDDRLSRMNCHVEPTFRSDKKGTTAEYLSSRSAFHLTRQFFPKSFGESKNATIDDMLAKIEHMAFSLKMSCTLAAADGEYYCAGVMVDGK